MDLKKVYYYIICLAALFVLLWGVVDLAGSVVGLVTAKAAAPFDQSVIGQDSAGEQSLDIYYQRKMFSDRLTDSLARIIVAGIVFGYSRIKVDKV